MLSALRSLTPFFILAAVSGLNALSVEGSLVQVVDVEAGKSYQQQVILKNEQNEMIKVKIQPLDCQQNRLDLNLLPPGTLERSNARWIEVVSEVELAPKSKVPIPFKINVPKKSQAGSSWSALAFTIVTAASTQAVVKGAVIPKNERAVQIRQNQVVALTAPVDVYETHSQPATLITGVAPGAVVLQVVTRQAPLVRGPVVMKGAQVVRNTLSNPQWQLSVENAGSSDLLLKSVLELRTLQGVLVTQIPGPTQVVMPASQVDYIFNLDKVLPGSYEAVVVFDDHSGNCFQVQTGLSF